MDRHERNAVLTLKICGVDEVVHGNGECGEKDFKCPAEGCQFTNTSLVSLKNHFIEKHNRRPYACDVANCSWAFPTKAKLERHKNAHLQEKIFKCKAVDCNKKFKTKSNLRHHEKMAHESEATFVCDVNNCGAKFRVRLGLDLHLREHEGSRLPYRCQEPNCGKELATKSALASHMRTHGHKEEDLKCRICDRLFEAPCRLRSHLQTHTGRKPFFCSEADCGWSFLTPSKLARHMERHSQRRKFHCAFQKCEKKFLRLEHLREHEKVHTRSKSYACSVESCDFECSARGSLQSHLREVHDSRGERDVSNRKKYSPHASAARTSLTYCDVVERNEHETCDAQPSEGECASSPTNQPSQPDTNTSHVQDDLLHQDYLQTLFDSSARFSDFEPSTVNLRDLD